MKKILIGLGLTLVVVSIALLIRSRVQTFDGYILWGRESVVFVEQAEVRGETVSIQGDPIWVEELSIPKAVYRDALVLGQGDSEDSLIVHITFRGKKETDWIGGYGHLHAYHSRVIVGEVIHYCTPPGMAGWTINIKERQRALLEEANKLTDEQKFSEAIARLDEGIKLNGPLNTELATMRGQLQFAAAVAPVWASEKKMFDQAMAAFNAGRLDEAEKRFKQVQALKDGRRQAEAQRYLSEIIPARRKEERNFASAQALLASRNPKDLVNAKGKLEAVIASNGPRKAVAQQALSQLDAKLGLVSAETLVAAWLSVGREALRRGDYRVARRSVEQVRALGRDPSGLQNEFDRAVNRKLTELISRFNLLRNANNANTLAGLAALQAEAKVFADATGNATAHSLAENEITAAMRNVSERRKQ